MLGFFIFIFKFRFAPGASIATIFIVYFLYLFLNCALRLVCQSVLFKIYLCGTFITKM